MPNRKSFTFTVMLLCAFTFTFVRAQTPRPPSDDAAVQAFDGTYTGAYDTAEAGRVRLAVTFTALNMDQVRVRWAEMVGGERRPKVTQAVGEITPKGSLVFTLNGIKHEVIPRSRDRIVRFTVYFDPATGAYASAECRKCERVDREVRLRKATPNSRRR